MEEATGIDKQTPQRRRIVTKTPSSIKRKPLANITNNNTAIRKSKKILIPSPTTASDSSIGSTPNPTRPVFAPPEKSSRLITNDHVVGNENRIVNAQRNSTQNTRSKPKADVHSYQTSNPETRNNLKERSKPLCSSNLDKVKDQGKGNQSCLDKTTNDGNKISLAPRHSSVENINDKRKTLDVSFGAHRMSNAKYSKETPNRDSTLKIKDNAKENHVQSGFFLPGNTSTNTSTTMHDSLMKRNDKGKAIAVDNSSIKNVKSNMVNVRGPLKGVVINDRGELDTGSNHADHAQRDEREAVATPNSIQKRKDKGKAIATPNPSMESFMSYMIEGRVPQKGVVIKDRGDNATGSVDLTPTNYYTLEKKDKRSSCPPLLRATGKRNEAEGSHDKSQSKPQTEPPPNKKMRRCSSKEEYALPRDYVEQQRAYFKEIDDFELQVEEV